MSQQSLHRKEETTIVNNATKIMTSNRQAAKTQFVRDLQLFKSMVCQTWNTDQTYSLDLLVERYFVQTASRVRDGTDALRRLLSKMVQLIDKMEEFQARRINDTLATLEIQKEDKVEVTTLKEAAREELHKQNLIELDLPHAPPVSVMGPEAPHRRMTTTTSAITPRSTSTVTSSSSAASSTGSNLSSASAKSSPYPDIFPLSLSPGQISQQRAQVARQSQLATTQDKKLTINVVTPPVEDSTDFSAQIDEIIRLLPDLNDVPLVHPVSPEVSIQKRQRSESTTTASIVTPPPQPEVTFTLRPIETPPDVTYTQL